METTLLQLPETLLDAEAFPVRNQEGLNSCTACAFADLIGFSLPEKKRLSPLFLYYQARKLIDEVYLNASLEFGDVLKAYQQFGICEEVLWPYNTQKFAQQPLPEACANAKAEGRLTIQTVPQEHEALASRLLAGKPIFCGIRIYAANFRSFERGEIATTGYMPNIPVGEHLMLNHAILLVGYDSERNTFWARNSAGKAWGINGHVEIEAAYILDEHKAFYLFEAH